MATSIILRYSKDLPVDLGRRLGAYCRIMGPELSIFEMEKASISDIAMEIQPFNKWLSFGPYFVPEDRPNFSSSDIVGAVLGPDEVQGIANPRMDFDPMWPSPCNGIVKEGIPIECRSRPKGYIEMVGNNLIFSKTLLRFVGFDQVGKIINEIKFKGKLLSDWVGFRFNISCNLIDPICFESLTYCNLCKAPYLPWRGVWLGKSELDCNKTICTDTLGEEHFQSRHPIVVSKEEASAIKKAFGSKGFSLTPIYHIESRYGQQIQSICRLFMKDA